MPPGMVIDLWAGPEHWPNYLARTLLSGVPSVIAAAATALAVRRRDQISVR